MFSKFFINRPIFSTVVSLLILLAGIVSIINLPIEQYPDLTPPSVQVSAQYPGASPEVIADTVAAPLEQQINGVEDMLYMNSTSSANGDMNLLVYFEVGTDPDQAMINVNNRVQAATTSLPEDVRRYGITVEKKSSAILQLITMYSPSGVYDTTYIGNYALVNVVDDLKRINGVGDAQVMSANDYSIRIWLKPDVMSQLGVSVTDVMAAVQAQNVQRAAGKIGQPPLTQSVDRMFTIVAPGRLKTPEEFEEIILRANPDGTSLRLKDVARVELGSQTYEFSGNYNNQSAVPIGVFLSPGANAVATAKAVDQRMKELSANFPGGIEYKVAYDTTLFVNASIEEVIHTLIEAMILVFLVMYLFLHDWRATLIPCLAVPVSIVGAFAGIGEQISNSIWSTMLHWFYETVYNAVADFFTQMGNMGAEIFDLKWVQATVWLFTLFGWALFAAGVVVAVFDLAIEYQNGRANVKTTVLNILKGFFACSLIGIVPVELYKFCISLQNTFAEDLSRLFADGKTYDLAGQSMAILEKQFSLQDQAMGSLFNLLILIAFAYCIIKVFFQNIKRGGILLVQMTVGSLYMFSVPRGYGDGFVQWMKQVAAICLTAFMQTTLLFLGLMTFPESMLLGLGIMLAANEVPRIAQQFGLDSSVRVNMMSVAHATTTAINLTRTIAGVGK